MRKNLIEMIVTMALLPDTGMISHFDKFSALEIAELNFNNIFLVNVVCVMFSGPKAKRRLWKMARDIKECQESPNAALMMLREVQVSC
jgi:hypothetical protein